MIALDDTTRTFLLLFCMLLFDLGQSRLDAHSNQDLTVRYALHVGYLLC